MKRIEKILALVAVVACVVQIIGCCSAPHKYEYDKQGQLQSVVVPPGK